MLSLFILWLYNAIGSKIAQTKLDVIKGFGPKEQLKESGKNYWSLGLNQSSKLPAFQKTYVM